MLFTSIYINTLTNINVSINFISVFINSYHFYTLSFHLFMKVSVSTLSNFATGLTSPKHILTYMCNGQLSPLAIISYNPDDESEKRIRAIVFTYPRLCKLRNAFYLLSSNPPIYLQTLML